MRPYIRASGLALALGLILLLVPPFSVTERVGNALDQRPEQAILFIGNARTSSNDMPLMLRRIADSAGYASKLRIETYGSGDKSMTAHSADPRVHALLTQDWDYVVLQAQSNEQIDRSNWGKWLQPTTELIAEARKAEASPAMFVAWRYTEQCPADLSWTATASGAMHEAIQQQHAWLAETSKVDLVNVGVVWERVLEDQPDFSLYADCSRPSVHGSYLTALMFFGRLLGGDIAAVTFRPDSIEPHQAERLRMAVSRYLGLPLAREPSGPTYVPNTVASTTPPLEEDTKGTIPAVCVWGIFAQMQARRDHCDLNSSPVDQAIDKALLQIEPHLIAAQELDPQAQGYYQRLYRDEMERASLTCDTVNSIRSNMTVDYVERLTKQILAASPGDFSGDCI